MEDANARLRGWQEDAELLLSFLEGFVRERQVVFCKFAAPYKQTLLRPVPTARCKNGRGPQDRTRGRRHNEVAREEQPATTLRPPFAVGTVALTVGLPFSSTCAMVSCAASAAAA